LSFRKASMALLVVKLLNPLTLIAIFFGFRAGSVATLVKVIAVLALADAVLTVALAPHQDFLGNLLLASVAFALAGFGTRIARRRVLNSKPRPELGPNSAMPRSSAASDALIFRKIEAAAQRKVREDAGDDVYRADFVVTSVSRTLDYQFAHWKLLGAKPSALRSMRDDFSVGYVFGAGEAATHHLGVADQTEALALISTLFLTIYGETGASLVGSVISNQNRYGDAVTIGGRNYLDLLKHLSGRGDVPSLELAKYLRH
jgi:hypothetical protein